MKDISLKDCLQAGYDALGGVKCTYVSIKNEAGKRLYTFYRMDSSRALFLATENVGDGKYVRVKLTEYAKQLAAERITLANAYKYAIYKVFYKDRKREFITYMNWEFGQESLQKMYNEEHCKNHTYKYEVEKVDALKDNYKELYNAITTDASVYVRESAVRWVPGVNQTSILEELKEAESEYKRAKAVLIAAGATNLI